ncbi:MAG: hypothetical protein ACREDW_12025 [Aestuariivirgaceae bacterium]
MGRILEMVARFFLTLIGLMLAMFVMRLVVGEARRAARVSRRAPDSGVGKDAALLKQDPVTGVYYPAD